MRGQGLVYEQRSGSWKQDVESKEYKKKKKKNVIDKIQFI